jgi:hypothetical protein
MTSKKQISANRANAKRSTGPKTATGKRRSSLNALKHGLTAQTIVVGDEDPAQFEALRDGYADDYSPATNTEQELVERLAAYSWRLRRIPLFEAAYMQCFEKQMRDKDEEGAFGALCSRPAVDRDVATRKLQPRAWLMAWNALWMAPPQPSFAVDQEIDRRSERHIRAHGGIERDQRAFGGVGETCVAVDDAVEDRLSVFHLADLEIGWCRPSPR